MPQDGQEKGHLFKESHQHCHCQLWSIYYTSHCAKSLTSLIYKSSAISHLILTPALEVRLHHEPYSADDDANVHHQQQSLSIFNNSFIEM